MRIIFIGYGHPKQQMGGHLISTVSLLSSLHGKGAQMAYFFTGEYDLTFNLKLEKSNLDGIRLYSVVNSPILFDYECNDDGDIVDNKDINTCLEKAIDEFKPDIANIQTFAGLPASIVTVLKRRNVRVVYTARDYTPICNYKHMYDFNSSRICPRVGKEKNCELCKSCIRKKNIEERKEFLLSHHLNNPEYYSEIILKSSRTYGIPKVIEMTLRDSSFKNAINMCDMLLCLSKETAEVYRRWGIEERKLRVLHVGTNPVEKVVRKYDGGRLNLLFIGYFDNYKGADLAVSAMEKIKDIDVCLYVLGYTSPYYYSYVERRLKNKILFSGYKENNRIQDLLYKCHIGLVLPNWPECGPMVLYECMLSGLPVIGTKHGTMLELINNGVNGYLINYNSDELEGIIRNIYNNPGKVESLSKNINCSWTINELTEELFKIYEGILK